MSRMIGLNLQATQHLASARRSRAFASLTLLVGAAIPWSGGGLLGADDDCAPFAVPRRVTDGTGHATQTATGLDVANNAYISSVIDEKIQVKIIGPALDVIVPLGASGLAQGDPDFGTTTSGNTYLSFIQLNENTPGEGREVYLTDNQGGGGQFHGPVNVSKNRADDYAPRLVLDPNDRPHLAWAQRVGEESRIMYLNAGPGGGAPLPAAQGDYPHLFVDKSGVVHLVYSRRNDLFYNNNLGGSFSNEVPVTTTAKEPESSATIGGDPGGNVLIAFESRNSLYLAVKPPGAAFQPAQLIDAGGILNPRMRVRGSGQVTIVYAKQGDIFYVVGQSTSLSPPERICQHTDEVESHPSLEIDLEGNIQISYLRDGEVYYTNTAAQLFADFAAAPPVGEVPLQVRFGDLSTGRGIQIWEWEFGDGATSSEQNPSHVYAEPGRYDVALTVSGPGGVTSRKVKEKLISVLDPFYTMRIPDQRVFPGQEEVWFPVITKRKDTTQGFQIMATYDPSFLVFRRAESANSILLGLAPEAYYVNDRGTRIEIGCIYEVEPPIDPNHVLPPGENQVLQQLIFDVAENAPEGAKTRVDLVNNYAISQIFNMFAIAGGLSKLPGLKGSTVEIIVVSPPFPRSFVRGDVDLNGELQLTDAVKVLNYLFTGGAPPACFDSADFNDAGKVDISAAVALLNYLFLGGPQPGVPFPNKGLDPTADDLPDCF